MRVMTAREKNLTTIVAIVGLFSAWWYLNRILGATSADLEAQIMEMNDRMKNSQKALDQMRQEIASVDNREEKVVFSVPQSKITKALLEDLTEPAESNMVKILSVQHAEGAAFAMVVEGKFVEMMRFISFLERIDSKFWVGNIQLGKSGDALDPNAAKVRGNIQIAMKG